MLSVVRYVRRLFHSPGAVERSDLQLIEAFAARRDEAAFAALVERHGPLVWGACRRALGHTQDAEDAFQATFLVLARKVGSVRWRDSVVGWLHAVAVRVTRKARERDQRRHTLEREAVAVKLPEPTAEAPDADLAAALDDEIQRLPEKYRRPVVLCYLQGKTYTEAARQLGWREGTVSGRLARARDLLRRRLERRGLAPTGTALVALLAAMTEASAVPARLVENTVRASLAFAAGQAPPTDPAAALAEGVLRTMFDTKLRIGVLLTLALVVAGVGVGLAARHFSSDPPSEKKNDPPRPPDDAPGARGPLPKGWEGRWLADPFADTVALEVRHKGQGEPDIVYEIKDPEALAKLLAKAKPVGVQNGMHAGLIPTAELIFHRKNGKPARYTLLGEESLQCYDGILRIDPDFFPAVNDYLSKREKKDIDFTVRREFAVNRANPPKEVKPSRKSLTEGFTELEVSYLVGREIHYVKITDAKTLDALHKKLLVTAERPLMGEKPRSRTLQIVSKDGSVFYGHIINASEIFEHTAGRFTIALPFMEALNKEVSRLEGRPIDVPGENPPTEAQKKRVDEFRNLVKGVKSLRYKSQYFDEDRTMTVDRAEDLQPLLASLAARVEAPPTEWKAQKRTPLAELTNRDGKKIEVSLVEEGPGSQVRSGMCDLVEVSGFGLMWIASQWKNDLHQFTFTQGRREKERRDQETARLVCDDFPRFLRHTLNVTVFYRQGEEQINNSLTAEQSKPVLKALAAARLEKLDWNEERWDKEVRDLLDRGAGTFDLAPGLGFSLMVVVKDEKELLIPDHGRLVFKESPLAVLKKAADAENADKVELLPGEKKE